MKLFSICTIFVIYQYAMAQQRDCVQEIDKVLQCKKSVVQSADAKKSQEEYLKVIDKCLGSDTVSKCQRKREECEETAESTAEKSPLKKQGNADAAKCFTNNQQGMGSGMRPPPGQGMPPPGQGMPPPGQGMPPPQGGPGQNGGMQPPQDDTDPIECMTPRDSKTGDCIQNELRNKADTFKNVDKQLEDCYSSLPDECIPQNPAVGMCLHQAYLPMLNLTSTTYTKCMTSAGYRFPTGPQPSW